MNHDHSDNKSEDKLEFDIRSDGIKLRNLSTYVSKHEAMDPNDFHHVSMHRGCKIELNMETGNNATPRLPQNRGHSGHVMSHLSCLNDNVTLTMSETKPEHVVLSSPQTKLSILVSTMRDEG